MHKIESLWPRIEQAIRLAVETVSSFGFTGKTLASTNALIPIVYYLFQRDSPTGFASSAAFRSDRETIQRWLNVALLKRTFGGVPDNVLRRIREVIRKNHDSFPSAGIVSELQNTVYALTFRQGELESLLDGKYGGVYTFPLLSMFYPSLDFRHKLHQDHIHPRSHFTASQLKRLEIPEDLHEQFMEHVDQIPNLQLLEGQPNIEKAASSFADWLEKEFQGPQKRSDYLKRNYIPECGYRLEHFLEFFVQRRQNLLVALRQLVGVDDSNDTEDSEDLISDEETAGFHSECMDIVERHLGIALAPISQTQYASGDNTLHIVCAVSKRYVRSQQSRYWYSIHRSQTEFLQSAERSFVVLGCGGAEMTVLIPGREFLSRLIGMRQTLKDGGRSYWHVELFGDSNHLELGQSLLNSRVNVTDLIVS